MACDFFPPKEPKSGFYFKLTDDFKKQMDDAVDSRRAGHFALGKRQRPIAKIRLGRGKAASHIVFGGRQYKISKVVEQRLDLCVQTSNPSQFMQIGPIDRKISIKPELNDARREAHRESSQRIIKDSKQHKTEKLNDMNGMRSTGSRRRPRPYHGGHGMQHQSKTPKMDIITRITHLLFLEPLSLDKIIQKLDIQPQLKAMAKKKVETVAEFFVDGNSGKYALKPDKIQNIDVEFKDYSPSDKSNAVRKLLEYNKKKARKKSPQQVKKPRKVRQASKRNVSSMVNSQPKHSGGRGAKSKSGINGVNGASSSRKRALSAVSNGISNSVKKRAALGTSLPQGTEMEQDFPKLTEFKEYLSYKQLFKKKYEKYEELKKQLVENSELFDGLAQQLRIHEQTGNRKKEKEVKDRIRILYTEKHQEVTKMKSDYNVYHEQLKILKTRIKDYVTFMNGTNGSSRR